jgi:hypothetical protein
VKSARVHAARSDAAATLPIVAASGSALPDVRLRPLPQSDRSDAHVAPARRAQGSRSLPQCRLIAVS